MTQKIPSEVVSITLDEASYKGTGTTISNLTYVNFFFGNNGTGKSTIAKSIQTGNGLTYAPGKSSDNYLPLVFNQEFIDANFKSYHNMPGVFTINTINATIQQKIDSKLQAQAVAQKAKTETESNKQKKESTLNVLIEDFKKECWDSAEDIRKEFIKTQDGKKKSKPFLEAIMSAEAKEIDISELRRLYDSAYSDTSKSYTEFTSVTDCTILDTVDGNDLLSLSIVNTSDTPFAGFLNKIKASQWVQEGHEAYSKIADGKCPYCQQLLPEQFEKTLADSFDAQYQENIKKTKSFLELYRQMANNLFQPLQHTPMEIYPKIGIKPYNDKLASIKTAIQSNISIIEKKIKEPERQFTIDSVSPLFEDLQSIINGYNLLIQENNIVVAEKGRSKKECTSDVFSYISFLFKDKISSYKKSYKNIEKEIKELTEECEQQERTIVSINQEIKQLNTQTVETESAKNSINLLLRDTGFQGFQLESKPDTPHVYQVIRPDGSIAETLSEGEKDFIAFLYFYHLVRGSESPEGETRMKIVVIDDPVSSMDSNSLFVVSTLVHEMVEICRNNANNREQSVDGNFIKQIFIMTHNAYFHREITNGYVAKYEYVSFYLIRKLNNKSYVKFCDEQNPTIPTERRNINPVKNSYAALWDEYKADLSAVPLINVIRRILEHYFLQLCGYEGATLRKIILKDGRSNFVDEYGNEDVEKYQMASSMLAYIDANSIGMNDDLQYVDDSLNVEECRKTFQTIFQIMKQDQHYNKMMGL